MNVRKWHHCVAKRTWDLWKKENARISSCFFSFNMVSSIWNLVAQWARHYKQPTEYNAIGLFSYILRCLRISLNQQLKNFLIFLPPRHFTYTSCHTYKNKQTNKLFYIHTFIHFYIWVFLYTLSSGNKTCWIIIIFYIHYRCQNDKYN